MADDMDIGPVEHTVRGGANHNIQVLVRVRPPNSRELDQVSAVLRDGTKKCRTFPCAHPLQPVLNGAGICQGRSHKRTVH